MLRFGTSGIPRSSARPGTVHGIRRARELGLDHLEMAWVNGVRMATIDGARVLHWDDEIGSLEVGKAADLAILDAADVSGRVTPGADLYDAIVYQYSAAQVRSVWVAGERCHEGGAAARG